MGVWVRRNREQRLQEDPRRPSSDELVRRAKERYARPTPAEIDQQPQRDDFDEDSADATIHQDALSPYTLARESEEGKPVVFPTGYEPPPRLRDRSLDPAPARHGRPGTIGWIIASAVFGAFVYGSAILGDVAGQAGPSDFPEVAAPLGSGDTITSSQLAIGECVMLPDGVDFAEEFEFTAFDRVACDQQHDLEVFGSFAHEPGVYPGEEELFDYANAMCTEAFAEFTGVSYGAEARLVFMTTIPDRKAWAQADYSVECLLHRYDGAPMVGSQKDNGILGYGGLEVSRCYEWLDEYSFAAFDPIPCDDAHDFEVFHITWTGHGELVPFPGEEWLNTVGEYRCGAEYEPYVGEPWSPTADVGYTWVVPTPESWEAGDRWIHCFLIPLNAPATT